GTITAEHYEDETAKEAIIDTLRDKMVVVEDKAYSKDYLDPEKRSIANAVQVHFTDGSKTENVEREYPLGHRFRREEAIPQVKEKYAANLRTHYPEKKSEKITTITNDYDKVTKMNVSEFVTLFLND